MSTTESIERNKDSYSDAFFLFDTKNKKILFSSVPGPLFFESSSLDLNHDFAAIFDSSDYTENIKKQWEACLGLKENQSHSFSFNKTDSTPGSPTYTINAQGIKLPVFSDSLLLFIHGKKSAAQNGDASSGNSSRNHQKDYAEFIDLAAHDLDAPLRKLSVLIDRVVDKIGGSADLQGHITRIQACLSDMRAMLDSLSTYAGIDADDSEMHACDLYKIAGEVKGELKQIIAEKNASVNINSLPIVIGNREQLKLLLKALLENSLRYCNKEVEPVVEVNTEMLSKEEKQRYKSLSAKDFFKITIRDNGIGFAHEDAEKIFRPFVRLNGKSEYPGSGMGLAICRKIAEKHNGIIYAEGHENNGASFTLILPQT
ncbi:sensor histidine kinase [Terrimonas alba]|uniref:sensor histidine kinase n=1 Tax=Terrimonas alba TaxID=3349636 RepID=UPI0035F40326